MEQADYNPYDELVRELQRNLSLQDSNPDKVVLTEFDDAEIISCLFRKNGKEFFKGTKNDGRRHLMMQFCMDFQSEEYKKFKALEFYDDFTDTEDDVIQILSIDCGDDAERAAEIYISVMTRVFDIRFSRDSVCGTQVSFSKKMVSVLAILISEHRLFFDNSFTLFSVIFYILYFAILTAIGLGLKECKIAHEEARQKLDYVESARMSVMPGLKNKSIEWLNKAAEQGNVEAQDVLGYRYYKGLDGTPLYSFAVKWWTKAAERGNIYAMNSLAICYAKGKGVRQDDDEAVRLWKKAAEMGNSAAEANLKFHEKGNDVYLRRHIKNQEEQRTRQKERSLQLLQEIYKETSRTFSLNSTFMENRKAAEQGDALAQYNLGQYYEIGINMDEDESMAFEWYSKAAKQGLVEAQDALGRCYHSGIGVERNDKEAVKWWLEAAKQGNMAAQNSLGICYAKGQGVEQDYEEAMKWWKKAIEQEDWAALENVKRYAKSQGAEQDYEEALKWWQKAMEQEY